MPKKAVTYYLCHHLAPLHRLNLSALVNRKCRSLKVCLDPPPAVSLDLMTTTSPGLRQSYAGGCGGLCVGGGGGVTVNSATPLRTL